jgi:hypothetical protein
MANFYLITIDPQTSNQTALHQVIANNPVFINWWHYLSSTYIVKTNENLVGVQAELQKKWPKNRYLLIKVDPKHRDGWLVPDAWKWFKDNVN